MMTIREYKQHIIQTLQPLYDAREAAAIANLYLEHRLQKSAYRLALIGNEPIAAGQFPLFEADLEQLRAGRPVQYVLGGTEFDGLRFRVSPAVLIPRPETEELVNLAVERLQDVATPTVWDLGTGSGCIAVALAKRLPQAHVYATDISVAALHVACDNAGMNGADVTFAQHDMADVANLPFDGVAFDMLISNPPYIPQSAAAGLHTNVRNYEPHEALFVPDSNPLAFYEKIGIIGSKCLRDGGCVCAETYEAFHDGLRDLFGRLGYSDFVSLRDLNGRKRMVVAAGIPGARAGEDVTLKT